MKTKNTEEYIDLKLNKLFITIIIFLGIGLLVADMPNLHYLLEADKFEYSVIREGDSLDVYALDSLDVQWSPIHYLTKEENDNFGKMLYRLELPDSLAGENRIFFIGFYSPFKVIYDSELVYEDAEMEQYIHLLSVKYSPEKQYLYFVYDDVIPGYPVPFSLIFLNEDDKDTPFIYLVTELLFVQILHYAVSIFFFLIALISLLLMLKSSKSLKKYLVAVFFYSIIIGLDHGLNTLLMAYIGITPKLYYWLDSLMFQLYLILTITMSDYIFSDGKFKFLKYIRYGVIAVTVINFLLTNLVTFYSFFDTINLVMYLVAIFALFFVLIKNYKMIKIKLSILIALLFILGPLCLILTNNFSYIPFVSSIYVLISILILYIFVYSFFVRYRVNESNLVNTKLDLHEKENKILKLERERLKSSVSHLKGQLNPHFLFNSLSTLTGIIHIDQNKAVNYVEELSTMYRYVLQTDNKELIELESERDFLDSYTYLLSIKYGKNYKLDIDIDDKYNSYFVPPLSLQTMIENVVKHNTIDAKHKMYIEIYTKNDYLIIKNTLNEKQQEFQYKQNSTGIGQVNLEKIYAYYTEEKLLFEKSDTLYIVKIPLLKK